MEIEEKYANLIERAEKIVAREGEGLRMIHDNFDPDWEKGDEPHGTLILTDNIPPSPIPQPPMSTHSAEIIGADLQAEKPLQIRRVWEGRNYDYDCYVAEELVLLYQAGKLHIGDTVLVDFLDNDPLTPIAILKVHKTWS